MRIVNFKQFNESLKNSLKNDKLNALLSKISDGKPLTDSEKNFLDNYDDVREEDLRDYTHLNSSDVYNKVSDLISRKKEVLYLDKKVEDVQYIKDDICLITFSDIIKLKDNYLYQITHNDDYTYTVNVQDEFFEKLPLRND